MYELLTIIILLLIGIIIHFYLENKKLTDKIHIKDLNLTGLVVEKGNLPYIKTKTKYINGKRHGKAELFMDNKLIQISYFRDGKAEGKCQGFYLNGNLKRNGLFKNGKHIGVWTEYFENGDIKRKEYYDQRERSQLIISYYKNGNIESEWKGGIYLEYHENGKLKRSKLNEYDRHEHEKLNVEIDVYFYNNGQLKQKSYRYKSMESPFETRVFLEEYWGNGKIKERSRYKEIEYFSMGGELLYTEVYENGKYVRKEN